MNRLGHGRASRKGTGPPECFQPAIRRLYSNDSASFRDGRGPASVQINVNERQKTISREARFEGRGLFSGETATVSFTPAAPNSGITFVREQDGKVATIPALVANVLKRPRRTCLRNGTLFV